MLENSRSIYLNTLALGREGSTSMSLATEIQAIEELKPVAKSLLAALSCHNGKRYADYDATTDNVAAYAGCSGGGRSREKAGINRDTLCLFCQVCKNYYFCGGCKYWDYRKGDSQTQKRRCWISPSLTPSLRHLG